MFCEHCGQPLADQARFCPSCGDVIQPYPPGTQLTSLAGLSAGGEAGSGEAGAGVLGPAWMAGFPALHWPEWSPRLLRDPDNPDFGVLTVDSGRVVWAWRCDGCGAASSNAEDFQRVAGDAMRRRCVCGSSAERTPAVFCASCDTLILLHGSDPDVEES